MAQDVYIHGVLYEDAPSVKIPKNAQHTEYAVFVDTTSGDATAGDILSGKKAWVDGSEVTGNIASKSSSDVTVSGATVTTPAGYYPSQVQKSVATQALPTPTVSISISGETFSVTPNISLDNAGYVASGSKSGTAWTAPARAAGTITPSTAPQTITSGTYLTGDVTISGDANLIGSNILSGTSIFGVEGTAEGGNATVTQDSSTKVLTFM